jgi:hypothetical protein
MRALGVILLFGIACLAGLVASEIAWRTPAAREAIAKFSGRGELRALVGGVAIYGNADDEIEERVIVENLRRISRDESVAGDAIEREMNLLRFQFGEEAKFAAAVGNAETSETALRGDVTEHLRARGWIEKQIAAALQVSDDECRQFYEANRAEFQQPQRFRAAHVFLAATDATPSNVVAQKEKAIKDLAARIRKGEALAVLAAEASEDEATKLNGGDLGFFAAARALPEFVPAIEKLRVGQISAPVRTHLGFHIVQLTEVKPPRQMTFEEARPEIEARLMNDKRVAAVASVVEQLRVAEFMRPAR